MKIGILALMLALAASPLWADFGLSNVVTKEIHRTVPLLETPAVVRDCKKEDFYPYTIHLSSWQAPEDALREREMLELEQEPLFITKINLGDSGVWYRLDYGLFVSIKDAVLRLRSLQGSGSIDKGAFVGGAVPYAVELGMFAEEGEARKEQMRLMGLGIIPYVVRESGMCFRLLVGAYPDMDSAQPIQEDLRALGLKASISKR